jgi:transaldolase
MDRLREKNFSLWCDFVERDFLDGQFLSLIESGIINGATSNPAIFQSAFLNSGAYQKDKQKYSSLSPKELYEELACYDIEKAADRLEKLYYEGQDGFISIEVDPNLSKDTQGTIEEGRRLFTKIGKPNVMIKIPATDEGYDAMRQLMREGINVNATLIFSPAQAHGCLKAMQAGLEECDRDKKPKGVISIFVSRFDRMLDGQLEKAGLPCAKVGIYNAMDIYDMIESAGIKEIRSLFASTGVKGDNLAADHYITELLLPNAVNTAPLATIEAFVANGKFDFADKPTQKERTAYFQQLKEAGIDMEPVYATLMSEGLLAFEKAFEDIMKILSDV